jgi:hypothetical protein
LEKILKGKGDKRDRNLSYFPGMTADDQSFSGLNTGNFI